jgi:hypothetical protein
MTKRKVSKSRRLEVVSLASLLNEMRISGRTISVTEHDAFIYFTFMWEVATQGTGRSGKAKLASGWVRDLRDRLAPAGSALRIVIDRLYPLPETKKKARPGLEAVTRSATEI